jgi:hypothetical protein
MSTTTCPIFITGMGMRNENTSENMLAKEYERNQQ